MSGARLTRSAGGFWLCVGMFSVLPVPSRAQQDAAQTAAGTLRWLPALGGVLGALASAPILVFWRGDSRGSSLLGAAVGIVALALLTRGLHLDGLADLADGLGSRRPASEAIAIMRKSDIGPFGVAAIVAALLLQVAALAEILSMLSIWQAVVCLVSVAAAARLSAVWAASAPSARRDGFGALVSGTASRAMQIGSTAAVAVAAAGAGALASMPLDLICGLVGSLLLAQLLGGVVRIHAVRRLGGTTGDVFGALIEITATACFLGFAAAGTWL